MYKNENNYFLLYYVIIICNSYFLIYVKVIMVINVIWKFKISLYMFVEIVF